VGGGGVPFADAGSGGAAGLVVAAGTLRIGGAALRAACRTRRAVAVAGAAGAARARKGRPGVVLGVARVRRPLRRFLAVAIAARTRVVRRARVALAVARFAILAGF
jgi:hypothetical protein